MSTAHSELAAHWDTVYREKRDDVSWYQAVPALSLELVEELAVPRSAAVIDAGAGASTFAESLLARGFTDVSLLDVSQTALARVGARLPKAAAATLINADVRSWRPPRPYDLWHDRATFHFMTSETDRDAYLQTLHDAVRPGGLVILATFAADGPEHCSNLPVARYSAAGLAAALEPSFVRIESRREMHHTPWGATQPFTWLAARRRAEPIPAGHDRAGARTPT